MNKTKEAQPLEMEDYLKPTRLCDCDNPRLQQKAMEITRGAETQKDAALMIFRYVRDSIPFASALDMYVRASRVLQMKTTDFVNKTTLQIALLRAVGIPSRCHYVRVRKKYLAEIHPHFAYRFIPDPVGNLYAECYLFGRWIACETLFDKPLYEGMLATELITREQIPTVDWDGETDLVMLRCYLTGDIGTFASCDDAIDSPAMKEEGMPPWIVCKVFGGLAGRVLNGSPTKIRQHSAAC